jgi:hypothetical protein
MRIKAYSPFMPQKPWAIAGARLTPFFFALTFEFQGWLTGKVPRNTISLQTKHS